MWSGCFCTLYPSTILSSQEAHAHCWSWRSLQWTFSGACLSREVNARRMHIPWFYFILTVIIRWQHWRDTPSKWPFSGNPDSNWWHRRTCIKFLFLFLLFFFGRSPWLDGQRVRPPTIQKNSFHQPQILKPSRSAGRRYGSMRMSCLSDLRAWECGPWAVSRSHSLPIKRLTDRVPSHWPFFLVNG